MASNKQIAHRFFKLAEGSVDKYVCMCGVQRRQKKNTGWMNLITHIQQQHKDKIENTSKVELHQSLINGKFLPSNKATNIYGWLDWITGNLLPFSFVEDERTRRNAKLEPICRNSLTKYMEQLTKTVETKIANELPENFALVLDGWSANL